MGTYAGAEITVRVPATSANLGPGFDIMGLALDLWDELSLAPADQFSVEVSGQGSGEVALDETHLVVSSIRAGLRAFGYPDSDTPFALRARNAIPHARGLGSSAAAIVAGLALAWGMARPGEPLDRHLLLELASRIEGHPDNAGAAIYGGVILAEWSSESVGLVQLNLDDRISARVWLPENELKTERARSVISTKFVREEMIKQSAAVGLLVHALSGAPEHLMRATHDWIHQQQRGNLMPESWGLVCELREDGVPAVISGAGPAVLALGTAEQLAVSDELDFEGFEVVDLAVVGGVELK